MNAFPLIMLFLFCFLVLVLAFFALSSCLGDEIRAAWGGRRRPASLPTTYGLQYARHMNSGGTNLEHIEMENMLDRRLMGHEDD